LSNHLTILIIRHAEKPYEYWPGYWPGPGLRPDGSADPNSLVVRGWQRAGAWSALFGAGLGGKDYPQPETIYASNPADPKKLAVGQSVGQREYQTIIPLSQRLNLTPQKQHAQDDVDALAIDVLKSTGVVLISWEHKRIVNALLPAIVNHGHPSRPPKEGLPETWNDSRYDVVLRFDRDAPGKEWTFRQLFPRLLSGDSDAPVDEPLK
jgi:hypothetical protein